MTRQTFAGCAIGLAAIAIVLILDATLATGLACVAAMIVMNASYLAALGLLLTLPAPRARPRARPRR